MANIMVVDDEVGIRELLSEILADEGHSVALAENAAAARSVRLKQRPDLVLLDIWMPDTDGISLLKEWSASGQLTMPVVMMSGHGTIDTAVEATRIGAADFLEKPIALQKLLATVKKALRADAPSRRQMLALKDFARLKSMHDFSRRLESAAKKAPVLLLRGANDWLGEVCARSLQVPGTPWVDLSTVGAALNQDMLQQATGGLLFVPDLATMGRLQQMNVSFALDRLNRYDQQLIVATTATTQQLIEHGWDQAVLQRLGEVWLSLPPLSEHADEIPEFARLVLGHLVERGEASSHQFSTAALNALRLHPWGGGWSELQKTVRNLALTALEEEIEAAEVHAMLGGDDAATPDQLRELFGQVLREARDGFERLYFEHHLKREKNNMTRLAERTGLERTHLYRKLKQLGIAIGRRQEE
jgi:two-component system, NtrC family, nitrogen regulation response regulator NtrX